MLILLLIIGGIGACVAIGGISYGCRSGFESGSPGRKYSILGACLFFVGFGLPTLWLLAL